MAEPMSVSQCAGDPRETMPTSELSRALFNGTKDLEARAEEIESVLFGQPDAKECSGGAIPTARGVDGDLRDIARVVERVHAVLIRIERRLTGEPD